MFFQNKILEAIIKATGQSSTPTQNQYKFAVNSTIIQHTTSANTASRSTSTNGDESKEETTTAAVGRRGMHSATGGYWNNEKDGMWSYKFEGGSDKGLDVVICVIWIAL
jgi:hypothetical protein